MMRMSALSVLLGGLIAWSAGPAAAETLLFPVDPVHSEVGFKVRHLAGRTPGHFNEFSGEIRLDPDSIEKTLAVTGTVKAASIDTGNEKRDNHLRSPDFFDVETYPEMTFVSRSVKKSGDGLQMVAELTMRGVTKEVVFDVEYNGVMTNPWTGTPVTGLSIEGTVNRKDFGIVWNQTLDAGGLLLGDEVKVEVQLEGTVSPEG